MKLDKVLIRINENKQVEMKLFFSFLSLRATIGNTSERALFMIGALVLSGRHFFKRKIKLKNPRHIISFGFIAKKQNNWYSLWSYYIMNTQTYNL